MYNIFEKNNLVNLIEELFLREFKYFYHCEENKTNPILIINLLGLIFLEYN